MFRKVMGDPPVGQIAFAFTTLGFLNALLMWPICVALYLTGTEIMPSDRMPWIILLIASILLLGKWKEGRKERRANDWMDWWINV